MKFYTTRQYGPFLGQDVLLVENDGRVYPFVQIDDPKVMARNIIGMFQRGLDFNSDPRVTQLPSDAQKVDMS